MYWVAVRGRRNATIRDKVNEDHPPAAAGPFAGWLRRSVLIDYPVIVDTFFLFFCWAFSFLVWLSNILFMKEYNFFVWKKKKRDWMKVVVSAPSFHSSFFRHRHCVSPPSHRVMIWPFAICIGRAYIILLYVFSSIYPIWLVVCCYIYTNPYEEEFLLISSYTTAGINMLHPSLFIM